MLYSNGMACCAVLGGRAFLFKQCLMGLGEWMSEERMLYSNGMEGCVVLGGRPFIQTTPYGIGRVDFKSEGCCVVMAWHVVL